MITSSKDLILGREAYKRIQEYNINSKRHLIFWVTPSCWLVGAFLRCLGDITILNISLTTFWFLILIGVVISIRKSSKLNSKDQAFLEELKEKYGPDINDELQPHEKEDRK